MKVKKAAVAQVQPPVMIKRASLADADEKRPPGRIIPAVQVGWEWRALCGSVRSSD